MAEVARELVVETEDALKRFSINTKKSAGKLKSVNDIKRRQQLLDVYWKEYVEAFRAFRRIKPTEKAAAGSSLGEYGEANYDAAEELYILAGGELDEMVDAINGGAGGAGQAGGANAVAAGGQGVFRLKAIDIPKFSGEIDDWVKFRDLFTSIVTNNPSLTNVHRLQHLQMACSGKAADLIGGIDVTDANFVVAWEALRRRYENERLLVSRLIERLINLPLMKNESAAELAKLLDATNQLVRSLGVLQRRVESWDDWLVVQTTLKLHFNTRVAWETSINTTVTMPTYNELDIFLSGVLRSSEAVSNLVPHDRMYSNKNERRVYTHVAAATNSSYKVCQLCNEPHFLYRCPQFINTTVALRREFVEANRLCYNCITSNNHVSNQCPIKHTCNVCQRHHHTMLHQQHDQASEQQQRAAGSSGIQVAASSSSGSSGQQVAERPGKSNPFGAASVSSNVCQSEPANKENVVLPTAWITATAHNGRSLKLRALIDSGSHTSIISEQAVQILGLMKKSSNLRISGIGEATAGRTTGCVRFVVSAFSKSISSDSIDVEAYILPTITSNLPMRTISKSRHPDLVALTLADNEYGRPGRIDVLLGSDVMCHILRAGVRKVDGLLAQESAFGWLVSGETGRSSRASSRVMTFHVQLDTLMQKFWEQEEPHVKPRLSAEDEACEANYLATTTRADDGRYVVELPFRQGGRELGESRCGAVRRLMQMEKKGVKYSEMYEGYKAFMDTYRALHHMEEVPANEIDAEPNCYLPHHAVFKPESSTTKIRVVFDATAATSNGAGLNQFLLTGPRLQETLAEILMRWRKHRFAISADIEKMYRQIWVAPAHCDYQRIVWRDEPKDAIKHYRLRTVTYGTAAAPYLAVKTLQRLADDESGRFPLASSVVRDDFYVDDCMSGADTVGGAIELKDELLSMMQAGGMKLMKWSSNCRELLATLPADYIECNAPLHIDDDGSIKALGVRWHPAADEFAYKVQLSAVTGTESKRHLLSEISRLFDPLGLLAPVIVTAKIMMQKLWLTGLDWDETLPEEVRKHWYRFREELPLLEEVRIKRWCLMDGRGTMQLHAFSDASQLAFGACVYARVEQADGEVGITLLIAKTKVAPIKQQSIPRLELNGAVLATKLLNECKAALRIESVAMYAWTDSTVVLAWLSKHANTWPTFVANRVAEIQGSMQNTVWQHVPGIDNPADVASRGAMPSEIGGHRLWWTGPDWLRNGPSKWPQQPQLDADEALLEKRKIVSCQVVQTKDMWELASRFSSLTKLLRITAYCRRWLKGNRRSELTVDADELQAARMVWIRLAQQHEFGDVQVLVDEQSKLRRSGLMRLRPIVDDDGILRVGGRLRNANLSLDEQHPVVLPAKNAITQLFIADAHTRSFHAGPQATLCLLQQRLWIMNGRRQVKMYVHRCVVCTKARPPKTTQLMGDLPAARVTMRRPFLHTAIDYAGPVWSRMSKGRGNKAAKSWIAVFVCLSTKAIHMELVSDVSSAAFVAAFRRFTARRGLCSDIYSDNGTNFVGADNELRKQLTQCLQDKAWRDELSASGTRFHFAPPGSPHFNGLAEAGVKSAKNALRKVIGDVKLTFEEMCTFLSQVEAALNSRPLCALQSDANDITVLTPGHFLTGHPLTAVPEPNALDERLSVGNRWHLVQQLTQHFWARWSREYLHQLHQRQKWSTTEENLKVGDVVIINDEMLHSTRWKLGRVIATHPGIDGCVRVVSVRTSTGILKRAIVKLSRLPIE